MTAKKRWLSHYPEEIPSSIDYEERSLQSYLKEAAARYPDKEALHFMGKEMTYNEIYRDALRLANGLRKIGIRKGDRVSIMLPNSPQAVISYYGVLLAGAIVVQTNPLYVERELSHQLHDSGAKIIICLDLVYPRVQNVRENSPLTHVIVTSLKDYLPFPKSLLYPLTQKKNISTITNRNDKNPIIAFAELTKTADNNEIVLDIDPKKDLALLQYTGGTTGPAKGVMLTHYNLVANTLQCRTWIHRMREGEERLLAVLPFFHVYGMTVVMNLSIMYAAKMIVFPKFNSRTVLKAVSKHKVTLFPGAPTMYIGLTHDEKIEKHDLSSIKACISGSAPLPLDVQQSFEKLTGGSLVEGYGLTEASPVVTANPIWGKRKTGSIGIPWPDTEVAVLHSSGELASYGEIGEIIVKGPQVMKGYWNRPEDTQASFKDGWLLTGDMGHMDEDGYFYVVDRKKDMIVAGGFNIYPREIEEVLFEHPAIQEAAVIGIPDKYRGETVKAFIVLKEGHTVPEDDLSVYCRKFLASYKIPQVYEYREELPKTAIGKVLRRVLSEEEKQKHENNNGC
ncbi:long-chain-fatty-acid--CoA ligase [Bacillus piscicola]|uniref:long-chain-fatty-acid--CoA ligase n=1 Tax=Bacillus piscicola TaxID=1632684 RepID=UPI001F08AEC2|nr:long-chain-fatty-acid--CoA ligase [Bacillus piscicola]